MSTTDSPKIPKTQDNGSKKQPKIRFRAPFPMSCDTCLAHICRHTKFYARETTTNKQYRSAPIYHLSIECPACAARIVIEAHPMHGYRCKKGARKTYAATMGAMQKTHLQWKLRRKETGWESGADEQGGPVKLENETEQGLEDAEVADPLDEI